MTWIVFLLILSVLVLIHEFGHFWVAKKLGIKVEEFGFGFPPKVFGKKKGETEYTINLFPIGGFVKLYGEDEAGAGRIKLKHINEMDHRTEEYKDIHRAFFARPPAQRMVVAIAGVVMNTVLAVAIFYLFLIISGFKTELPLLFDHKFIGVNQVINSDVIIDTIAKNSPAEQKGIRPTSKVVSVNSEKIDNSREFSSIISENKGREIVIELVDIKTNSKYTVQVMPRLSPPKNQGALGVGFTELDMVQLRYDTPLQKIFSGFIHPYNLLSYNFDVIGKLISISFKEKNAAPVGDAVSGPVGIFKVVEAILQIENVKERFLQILNITGILSISLAFFNILPIPALDGGRLFFILFEMVTGRKIPVKYETLAHTIGFALLLSLIILVTFKDIIRFF